MALTYYQIGAIVSGCSGAVLLVIILVLVFIHLVRRSTFSRRKCPSSIPTPTLRDEENQHPSTSSDCLSNISPFETIGNLTISPGHQSLPLALDIINRVAMAIPLPADAKPARLKRVPGISLHLPPLIPIRSTTKVNTAMAEAEAKAKSLHTERDATCHTTLSRQAPLVRHGTTAQKLMAKDKAGISSQHAVSAVATETHGIDLGLKTPSVKQLERVQEDVRLADNEMADSFGSDKAMAALYHAV